LRGWLSSSYPLHTRLSRKGRFRNVNGAVYAMPKQTWKFWWIVQSCLLRYGTSKGYAEGA